jgi:biotin carboxyl carrier protein
MKREFTLTMEGVEYPVIAEGDTITVNGRPFTVEIADDGAVLVDGITYDVTLEGETAIVGEESYTVQTSGLALTAIAPPPTPSGPAAVEAGAGAVSAIMPGKIIRVLGAVSAIMPGKIIRVLVEPGQQVEEGEPVCVLEAMKMENELSAPRSGTVQAVHVKPGDDVEKDLVLVEIE